MDLKRHSCPQRIAIFGAGLSGRAALRLVQALGSEGRLFDQNAAAAHAASIFEAADVSAFDAFICSPGFAASHPWRVLAETSGKPCFSELGFASQYWQGALYAVTGTNGKTTICNLLTETVQASGRRAIAAGNIGYPLSDAVLSDVNQSSSYAVCEVSSFQAELPRGLQLDALLWSNFAEDHLDRYDSMQAYFNAKAQLFSCLKPAAICLLGPEVECWLERYDAARPAQLQIERSADCDLPLAGDSMFRIAPHCKNLALVAAFWTAMGGAPEALLQAANQGKLAPHRLRLEATWEGVNFWNDSKATNFHAALAALDALEGPIFWIGGGQSKGGDLAAFAGAIANRVEAAFLYGAVGEEFGIHLSKSLERVEVCGRLEYAISSATGAARLAAPAQVLFSPGFASFDQFSSYAARGKCFISEVLSLMHLDSRD